MSHSWKSLRIICYIAHRVVVVANTENPKQMIIYASHHPFSVRNHRRRCTSRFVRP